MILLNNYGNNVLSFVSDSPVNVGDSFVYSKSIDKQAFGKFQQDVVEVIEQRPEKGVYQDESRRRIWTKAQMTAPVRIDIS